MATEKSFEDLSVVRLIRCNDDNAGNTTCNFKESIKIPKNSILMILTKSPTAYNTMQEDNVTENKRSEGLLRYSFIYTDENNQIKNYGRRRIKGDKTITDLFNITMEPDVSAGFYHNRELDTQPFNLEDPIANGNFENNFTKFLTLSNISIPFSGSKKKGWFGKGGKTKKHSAKKTVNTRTIKNITSNELKY